MILTRQGQEDAGLANRWITLTRQEQREWGLKDKWTHYYWRGRAAIVNVAMEQWTRVISENAMGESELRERWTHAIYSDTGRGVGTHEVMDTYKRHRRDRSRN